MRYFIVNRVAQDSEGAKEVDFPSPALLKSREASASGPRLAIAAISFIMKSEKNHRNRN
jgi:hypothetical protein